MASNDAPNSNEQKSPSVHGDKQAEPEAATVKSSPPSAVAAADPTTPSSRSSWYGRTWPRKAAPVTQVAREGIALASNTAIDAAVGTATAIKDKVASSSASSRRSSLALTLGHTKSRKSLPVTATATRDNVMPHGKRHLNEQPTDKTLELSHSTPSEASIPVPTGAVSSVGKPDSENDLKVQDGVTSGSALLQTAVVPQSWIGWLAGPDGKRSHHAPTTDIPIQKQRITDPVPNLTQVPEEAPNPVELDIPVSTKPVEASSASSASQRRSWLPVWHNSEATQSAPAIAPPKAKTGQEGETAGRPHVVGDNHKPTVTSPQGFKESEPVPNNTASPLPISTKPQGWLFWSREKVSDTSSLQESLKKEVDVSGVTAEPTPRRASIDSPRSTPQNLAQDKAAPALTTLKTSKRDQKSGTPSKGLHKTALENGSSTTKVEGKTASAVAVAPTEAHPSRTASPLPTKKQHEHFLLPSLHSTLKLPDTPTLLQQLTRLLYSAKEPELKHLSLLKDPPRIKNCLVIGVHGYFPAPLIQSVLGRPTGTSIKFAEMAAKSIKQYTRAHGYDCTVKTAALEGEGRIAERIDLLWKLLLNWIDDIRKADFIFIAAHSQGVPVAIMLVAKLIHFGCIGNARLGICAMAGVNSGPFPEYKSRWISGSSAGELFEFADPNSKVSKDYMAALTDVLKFGVRLTYVGSLDDQLVSMDSSIHAPVSHPHIYRAVSIDSRLNAPDFVSHLVAFALKLRNLGVQDHGLIKELSAPLAGSLYTGDGHSRLYEDASIYKLAITFAIETTSMPGITLTKRDVDTSGNNPYILPFAMRGILEEDFVKSDLQEEVSQLLKQFDDWKPQTKALKDVKFRLEGIRSKL